MKRKNSTSKKAVDLAIVSLIILLAAIVSISFRLNFLYTILLYFGLPSLYLTARNPGITILPFIFSLTILVPVTLVMDYLAYLDNAWFVPNSLFRFLRSSTPIEDFPWGFLWVYLITLFWEYFLSNDNKVKLSKNFKYLIWLLSILLVGFFMVYYLQPEVLVISYMYFKLSIFFVLVPIILFILRFPDYFRKLLLISAYFFIVSMLMEYVRVTLSHWYFSGVHYIGYVNYFGHKVPYEEILFWWILAAPAVICWYKIFVDDKLQENYS